MHYRKEENIINPLKLNIMKYIVILSDGRRLEVNSKSMVEAIKRNAVIYNVYNSKGLIVNHRFGIK